MRFTHRAGADWALDPTRTYVQPVDAKPHGLWLSVDGDWDRWLTEEGMLDENALGRQRWGTTVHDVDLVIERCLLIDDLLSFDRFHVEHAIRDGILDGYRIDWTPIAERHAGIVVAPYLWQRRNHGPSLTWYYGWDCASACIWDLTAVSVPATTEVPA